MHLWHQAMRVMRAIEHVGHSLVLHMLQVRDEKVNVRVLLEENFLLFLVPLACQHLLSKEAEAVLVVEHVADVAVAFGDDVRAAARRAHRQCRAVNLSVAADARDQLGLLHRREPGEPQHQQLLNHSRWRECCLLLQGPGGGLHGLDTLAILRGDFRAVLG